MSADDLRQAYLFKIFIDIVQINYTELNFKHVGKTDSIASLTVERDIYFQPGKCFTTGGAWSRNAYS